MQKKLIVKGASLGMTSDLTLIAPVREGFVLSLDTVSFRTRVKRVLAVLHDVRQTAYEHSIARLFSDAVERVGVIHSVRVAMLEPENGILLSVTFDGPWQSYIRVLWDKVGALLDLIFCNAQDYPLAATSSFERWAQWVENVQRETGFFYAPESTAHDALFDRRLTHMRLRFGAHAEAVDELRAILPDVAQRTSRVIRLPEKPTPDDPPLIRPSDRSRATSERFHQYIESLAALYALTEWYPPTRSEPASDGEVLRRAAIELLDEMVDEYAGSISYELTDQRARFARALDWICPPGQDAPRRWLRERPPIPGQFQVPEDVLSQVQPGIVQGEAAATHGAILLFTFDTSAAAAAMIAALRTRIKPAEGANSTLQWNVALSCDGLRMCGLDEEMIETLPLEFRQGMAARAGLLGDVGHNHPRRWRLPHRFVGVGLPPAPDSVDLAQVHALVQVRCRSAEEGHASIFDLESRDHPLANEVTALAGLHRGARLVAVQSLRRHYRKDRHKDEHAEFSSGHFGYIDGMGQPTLEWKADDGNELNRVPLGDVLWGHANRVDLAVSADDQRRQWLLNGSFLAVRKYRQFPERLEQAVNHAAAEVARVLGGDPSEHVELVYAKLMGRARNGEPLVEPYNGDLNEFDYDRDSNGQQCPLHAHIRRANPRTEPQGSARPARIVRRGMSYGPDSNASVKSERGLIFMAYCQNLGEQFETVQRWLAAGNSTGASSAVSCPIVGVPGYDRPRRFAFEVTGAHGRPYRIDVTLDTPTAQFEDPLPITELQWGMYLFAPSLDALARLEHAAHARADGRSTRLPWETPDPLSQARARLQSLLNGPRGHAAVQAWKHALEDPDEIEKHNNAALWSVIRHDHGGALSTRYGILVADHDLALHVLGNDQSFSVCGQHKRMQGSLGHIYLGLDSGARYARESAAMNAAIEALDPDQTFVWARDAARQRIQEIVALAKRSAKTGETQWSTRLQGSEVVEAVLVALSDQWFGLQDNSKGLLARGAEDWHWQDEQASLYPGHFIALSRNLFQPHPGELPVERAKRYGNALRRNMTAFVRRHRDEGRVPRAPDGGPARLAEAAFAYGPGEFDDEFVATLINGVLMGYTPTITGAVLNVLSEWWREKRFGALRLALAFDDSPESAAAIVQPAAYAAACMRPMPQLTWRIAKSSAVLNLTNGRTLNVRKGRRVILGMVSGTQQALASGRDNQHLMFGGTREPGGPTHACPGRTAGQMAMLGTLVALLTCQEDLSVGTSSGIFHLKGQLARPHSSRSEKAQMQWDVAHMAIDPDVASSRVGLDMVAIGVPDLIEHIGRTVSTAPPAGQIARWSAELHHRAFLTGLAGLAPTRGPQPAGRTGTIMAWGDSWVSPDPADRLGLTTDLRRCLRRFGYTVDDQFCDHNDWGTLRQIATNSGGFVAELKKAINRQEAPRALLLSAGGNDSVRHALEVMLIPQNAAVTGSAFDRRKLEDHFAALRIHFQAVFGALEPLANKAGIKLFVHGYDYPIPMGKGLTRVQKEWLYLPFTNKGYVVGAGGKDLATATAAMVELIDGLHEVLRGLSAEYDFVRTVDLRGTIGQMFANTPAQGWWDDMHPEKEVFVAMAGKIDDAIQKP